MKSIFALGLGCLGFFSICALGQIADPPATVTTPAVSGSSGGAGSYSPVFSADGRFLVFISSANNLVTNDDNARWLDVFVRNLTENTTTLVSVDSSGFGGGNGNSYNPTISSNGQFIAFESAASNLAGNDANGASDIFVRDLISKTTVLVSINSGGTASGSGASRHPVISPDGRYVGFESLAPSLVANASNGLKNVFVRDMQVGVTYNASTGSQSPGVGSESPSISADGQRVAFASDSVLLGSKPKSTGDVYVRDFASNVTIWVSTNIYTMASSVRSFNPDISADGRFVVFKSTLATTGVTRTNLYQHDLQTSNTTLIASNVWVEGFPEMTPDGRFVAYESRTNLFRWDSTTGSNLLVNVDLTGTNAANGTSYRPVISPDGSKVAFLSDASNLTTNGGNGQPQIYLRDLTEGTTRLVSVHHDGQPGSSASGIFPALSVDGNWVAFWSADENFVADDHNRDADVFLRDINGETTSLVSSHFTNWPSQTSVGYFLLSGNSVSADGRFAVISALGSRLVVGEANVLPHIFTHDLATGANFPVDSLERTNGLPIPIAEIPFPTNLMSRSPVLSANGRYVAYLAKFTTDDPAVDQVYIRDLQSQTNWLASRPWNGAGVSPSNSSLPSVSGDGMRVAFQSDSPNLVPNDANGSSDVFVYNVRSGSNTLISVKASGNGSGNGPSTNPVISKDGRWVAFQSKARDLGSTVNGFYFQLFARDLTLNTTKLVSALANGSAFSGDSGSPILNPGGNLILFTNGNNVFLGNLIAQTNTLVCSSCFNPTMSADGRWVVYESVSSSIKDVFVKDLQTGIATLISANSGGTGGGNRSSTKPIISFDGRYIVFASRATNLVVNDTNGMTDIFVRDRIMNTTILASVNRQGTGSANGVSSSPKLGADGRTVIFQSFASDLVGKDFNNNRDIFVLRLSAGDSDNDDLDDDWEFAYFGNLVRDGSGDYDGDGHTDAEEFALGTDPTNLGSVLRVVTVARVGGNTTVLWSATPGKKYQVQFKTGIGAAEWTNLGGVVIASDSTAMQMDDSGSSANRFYRVQFVP